MKAKLLGLLMLLMTLPAMASESLIPDTGVNFNQLISDIGTYVGGIVVAAIALRFAFIGVKAGISWAKTGLRGN